MPDTDAAYRVRMIETSRLTDGVERVVIFGPYATVGAARGQATRLKPKRRNPAHQWDREITVERATGWETV